MDLVPCGCPEAAEVVRDNVDPSSSSCFQFGKGVSDGRKALWVLLVPLAQSIRMEE